MRRKQIFVIPLFLIVNCAVAQVVDPIFADGFESASGGISEYWQANLNVHNALRATVSPAASPALSPLTWSTAVAAVAQSYADRCVYGHSGTSGLGENIFGSSGWTNAEERAATLWAGEEPYYNYASNSCASGQQCGHYTQMVWRATTQLGCGIKQCSTGSPLSSSQWTYVVCNYSTPGNYVGQRPY